MRQWLPLFAGFDATPPTLSCIGRLHKAYFVATQTPSDTTVFIGKLAISSFPITSALVATVYFIPLPMSAFGPEHRAAKLPQKRFFRQRAHANPFSDHSLEYPVSPNSLNLTELFPTIETGQRVTILDVGCGYGGFLVSLSELFPKELIFGLEIRTKLVEYVRQRIVALRQSMGKCNNAMVIRTNAMKFLPNFIHKGQLSKIFFLFPDPHFKRKKHKARIITDQLLTEYAYFLRPGGELYIATDVKELFDYMAKTLEEHHLFERIPDDQICPELTKRILFSTEESMKVDRKGGEKFMACFKRK